MRDYRAYRTYLSSLSEVRVEGEEHGLCNIPRARCPQTQTKTTDSSQGIGSRCDVSRGSMGGNFGRYGLANVYYSPP